MRIAISLGLILVLGLFFFNVTSVNAESISKPSVPEFTVAFVDASYDIPTSYSIDPYTGENITHPGYHVQNRTIEVTIKNQPFTPTEKDGQIINLYLNIRTKGAYTKDWIEIYSPDRGFLTQSSGEYTKVAYSLDDNEFPFWDNIPQGGTVDFQVEALAGSVHRGYNPNATDQLNMYPYVFTGETSGWSNTQTATVPQTDATPSPTVPEFPALAVLPLLATASLATIILRKKLPSFRQA